MLRYLTLSYPGWDPANQDNVSELHQAALQCHSFSLRQPCGAREVLKKPVWPRSGKGSLGLFRPEPACLRSKKGVVPSPKVSSNLSSFSARGEQLWIVKPSASSQGRGIFILRNLIELPLKDAAWPDGDIWNPQKPSVWASGQSRLVP